MSKLKIACVGDIMCGDSFYALGRGVASSLDRYGRNFLPSEIVDVFSEHDMVLCNIESVLSDVGRKEYSLRSLHMRGRPKVANYLAEWGITVAHMANNHILEQGSEAAVDTVQQLEQAGINVVGSGKDGLFQRGVKIAEATFDNMTVATLGACFLREKYAYYGGAELDELLNAVSLLAAEGKIVIVSAHWGNELIKRPALCQRQIGRQLLQAGASLVIGHHSHVVQGIEKVDDGLIAYSLGNFIFDSFLSDCEWSIILSITISHNKIIDWQCFPIQKDSVHRPALACGKRKDGLQREVEHRCNLLKEDMTGIQYMERYKSELQTLDTGAKYRLRRELLKKFWAIRPVYWPQILLRPIQRRTGLW